MAPHRQSFYRGSDLPASPTMRDLGDPVWLSHYNAARRAQPVGTVTVADTLKPNPASHLAAVAAQVNARTAHQLASFLRRASLVPTRATSRIMDDQRASRSRMARSSRVADIFGPTGTADVFPLAKRITRSKVEHDLERPGAHSVFESLERHDAMLHRALGITDEPTPGTVRTPIRPRSPIKPPPSDEVLEEMQAECRQWLDERDLTVALSLDSAHDALARDDWDALAHAMLSCRRALVALIAHVYPPVAGMVVVDRQGEERDIGPQAWKNRCVLFFQDNIPSRSGRRDAIAEVELLGLRLDALNNKLGRAIHEDLPRADARRTYVSIWQLVAEILRHAP